MFLISGAPLQLSRPPPGLAFMAGVCEKVKVDYVAYDLNFHFLKYSGKEIWNKVFLHINTGHELTSLPTELLSQVDLYLEHVVQTIVESQADCVAMSLFSYIQQGWTERFLQKLRLKSSIITIAGGSGVSVASPTADDDKIIFGQQCANNDLLDYYVLGEGDFVFEQFLLGNHDNLGINARHSLPSWQPQLDNLDICAVPSYSKIDFSGYDVGENGRTRLSVTASRGCVRRCTFCDVGHIWKKYRYRSGDNVAQEILKHYQDTGSTDFWFSDSLINGSLTQFTELMTNFSNFRSSVPGMSDLSYTGQFIIRPKGSHPEKMFKLMGDSGCSQLLIGIESGSESVREHMGKKFSDADIQWHFEMCEKYKIKNWLLMIVGYPTETEEDFEKTKEMLIKNQRYILNHTILGVNLVAMMAILPNTPIESMSNELGIHHIDGLQGAYINWVADSNPDLTLTRRYQRFAELAELCVELRYNLPRELHYFLQKYKKIDRSIIV